MLRFLSLLLCACFLGAQTPPQTEVLVTQVLAITLPQAKPTTPDVLHMDLEWIDARGRASSGKTSLKRHYLRYQYSVRGQVQDPPCEGRCLVGEIESLGETRLRWEANDDIFSSFATERSRLAECVGFPWPYPIAADLARPLDPPLRVLLAQLVKAEGDVRILKSDLNWETPVTGENGLLISGPLSMAVNGVDGSLELAQRYSGSLRIEATRKPLRLRRLQYSGDLEETISDQRGGPRSKATTRSYRFDSQIALDWDPTRIAAARSRPLSPRTRRFNLLQDRRFRIILEASSCWSIEPLPQSSTVKHTGAGQQPAFALIFEALRDLSPEALQARIEETAKADGFTEKLDQEHKLGRHTRILIAAKDGLRCVDFLQSPEGVLRMESLTPKAETPDPRHEEFLRGLLHLPRGPRR